MVALTRAVGRKRAMHMLLTGEAIDAETAADWGLLSGVVDDAELGTTVRELALHIAGSSARTVSIGKQAFYKQIELDEASAYVEMSETMATNAMTWISSSVTPCCAVRADAPADTLRLAPTNPTMVSPTHARTSVRNIDPPC